MLIDVTKIVSAGNVGTSKGTPHVVVAPMSHKSLRRGDIVRVCYGCGETRTSIVRLADWTLHTLQDGNGNYVLLCSETDLPK